jgi:hypothetical protein
MEDMSSLPIDLHRGDSLPARVLAQVTLEGNPQQGPSVPFPEPITALDSVPCMFLAGWMPNDDEPIRPMTLGSMRQHGVRGFFVTSHSHYGHERAVGRLA